MDNIFDGKNDLFSSYRFSGYASSKVLGIYYQ